MAIIKFRDKHLKVIIINGSNKKSNGYTKKEKEIFTIFNIKKLKTKEDANIEVPSME